MERIDLNDYDAKTLQPNRPEGAPTVSAKQRAAWAQARREKHPPGIFTDDVGNLKFVNIVVRHPCKIFIVLLLACFAMTFLLFQVVFAGGNPFADPGSQYDTNDVRSLAYDSLRLATEAVEEARSDDERRMLSSVKTDVEGWARGLVYDSLRVATDTVRHGAPHGIPHHAAAARRRLQSEERVQETNLDITYWVYEAEDESGVFGSAESIRGMRESFDLFTDHPDFQSYCWLEYITTVEDDGSITTTTECRQPLSSLNMFYASSWDTGIAEYVMDQLKIEGNIERYNDLSLCVEFDLLCEFIPFTNYTDADIAWVEGMNNNITALTDAWDGEGDLQEDNLEQVSMFAAYMMELRTKRFFVDFGVDKNFNLTNPVSMFSRAIMFWGGPFADEIRANFTEEGEEEDEGGFTNPDTKALTQYFVDNFLDEMNELATVEHSPHVNSFYFMGILILDVLFAIVQRDAMLAIASFIFVFVYLRLMVGSWFLASVGMTEILLSVPISWFIYDTVLQIKYFAFLNVLSLYIVAAIGADDIFIFMDAYKQSAYTDEPEILENLESRMSWVYRRTGSAMLITSLTTCSAFLCTLITPLVDIQAFGIFAAIVIFIDYALVMSLFCTAVVIYHNKFEQPGCFASCCSLCRTQDPTPTDRALGSINDEDKKDSDWIGEFFRNKFTPFILSQTNRLVIFVIFAAWLGVAGYNVSRLEPTQEAEQFLKDDHPLQRTVTIINNEFEVASDDLGLEIFFNWGLGEVDRDGVNLLIKPDFIGKAQFVDTFEFNEQCQTELLQSCNTLRTSSDYEAHIKQNAGTGSVFCFMEEFAAYSVLGSLTDCEAVLLGEWRQESWQVAVADLPDVMDGFLRERSCSSVEGRSIADRYGNQIGWDGTEMKFAGLALESSVVDPFSTLPEETVRTEYDKMIEIAADLDKTMKDACGSEATMTDLEIKFVFMNNQRIYARAALQSSFLGVGIAFTVLLIATRAFHIALFATFSIASVLVSVTGSMVLLGWNLGSIESVLISIVAGFSVDYVVHLSHAYVQAKGDTAQRLTAAFGEMGISVLNGMVTSVGASIPLFFCQLTFFRKFGTFLCLTIAFSWVFANFGFMSVLAQLKIPIRSGKSGGSAPPATSAAPVQAPVETQKVLIPGIDVPVDFLDEVSA